MDKLCQNLHVLLWTYRRKNYKISQDKALEIFSQKTGVHAKRLRTFLLGKEHPLENEITKIASAFGFTIEELHYGDLLEEYNVDILNENIRCLFEQLPRGGKAEFAKWANVDPSTVNRWINKGQTPSKDKLKKIKEYFQLNEYEDLKKSLLFLNLEPVGERQRKDECHKLLDEMSSKEFSKIYPALKKLLSE